MSTHPASEAAAPPRTPTSTRTGPPMIHHPATTPRTRSVAALAASSSLKRVSFSPRNEEIALGATPHSSPTQARTRALKRGILKRGVAGVSRDQGLSSDGDCGENSLMDRLSSLPSSPNGYADAVDDVSAFPRREPGTEYSLEEAYTRAVHRLEQTEPGEDVQSMAALSNVYNELCGLIAKDADGAARNQVHIVSVLGLVRRDIGHTATARAVVLAATKCLGCALHIESICTAAAAADQLWGPLEALRKRVEQQFLEDKVVCQAAVWCVSMLRAPASAVQGAVPGLVQLCVSVLSRFPASATIQYECLAALEQLLRRMPTATRRVARLWLFPVLGCIVSPIPGVRAKADGIVRNTMPWVAADAHKPDMDALAREFVETRMDHTLAGAMRLLGQGEHVLVARIWGMLITVCARHCRAKLNAMLKLIQECFTQEDSPVLQTVALAQWRCLIYAFALENRVHLSKCVQLVLKPLVLMLGTADDVDVRLASVRCWATLVYALGAEIGSNVEVISKVVQLAGQDSSCLVHGAVARVLAALFNKFTLPKDRIARFVIPAMAIGTTTLAAEDGKSLSNTHGPFSSETEFTGDHTRILCRYVVGLGHTSPTVPVVAELVIGFLQKCVNADHKGPGSWSPQPDTPGHGPFRSLCSALASTIATLPASEGTSSHRLDLATKLAHVYLDSAVAVETEATEHTEVAHSGSPSRPLYTALFAALTGDRLRELLSAATMAADAPALHIFDQRQMMRPLALAGQTDGDTGSYLNTTGLVPGPDLPDSPSYLCALARAHLVMLVRQAHTICRVHGKDSEPIVCETVEHIRLLLGGIWCPKDAMGVRYSNVLACVMAAARLLDNLDVCEQGNVLKPAAASILELTAAAVREMEIRPALVGMIVQVYGRLQTDAQLLANCTWEFSGGSSRSGFSKELVGALLAAENDGGLIVNEKTLDLIYTLCAGHTLDPSSEQDVVYCNAFAIIMLIVALRGAVEGQWSGAAEAIARVLEPLNTTGLCTVDELHTAAIDQLKAMALVVKERPGGVSELGFRAVHLALSSVVAVAHGPPASISRQPVKADGTASIPPCPKGASDLVHTLTSAAEDLARALSEPDEPPPASSAPRSDPPVQPTSSSKRKRERNGGSSSDESDAGARGESSSVERQYSGKGATAATAQRRGRKRRARRKRALGAASRLAELLDQLDVELETAASYELDSLLGAQGRIVDMQQRLCEAMRSKL
ncbi:Translation machinery-associated protein 22 [Coemansia sp. RSA 552]|nr:Translation machinery-associated protein 22 [Coemansia sp. RSA 552]